MFQKQLGIVIRQTFKTRLKTKGFWLVVLSPILLVALVGVIVWVMTMTASSKTPVLGVVGEPSITTYLKQSKSIDVSIQNEKTLKKAQYQLSTKKIDGYLVEKADDQYTLVSSASGEDLNADVIKDMLSKYRMVRKAHELSLSDQQLIDLTAPVNLKTTVQSAKGESQGGTAAKTANYSLSVALGVGIFIFLTYYAGMVANEIANEKSSRIMEILLAATNPAVQFFGKIIGVSSLAIVHGLIYVVAGLVVNLFLPDNSYILAIKHVLSGVDLSFVIMTMALVLVGIVLYLILTAIVAALVNDQSQVQQAVAPISYLAMIGYILSFTLSGQPNNFLIKVLSFVPFISQTLMPSRLGLQYASVTDGMVALVIELVAVILLARYGLRVYKQNVLQYSDGNLTKAAFVSLRGLFIKPKD